jgi:hypothetical protein
MSGYGELEARVKQEIATRARAAQGVAHG